MKPGDEPWRRRHEKRLSKAVEPRVKDPKTTEFGVEFYEDRLLDKLPTSDNPENDAVVNKALKELRLRPGNRVLDFGCSDGYFSNRLAEGAPGVELHGIDLITHERWRSWKSNVTFAASELPLPYADGFFDAIFSSQVLEHVPDPGYVAREFARVLKARGRAWIATPNSYEEMWSLFHGHNRRVDEIEGHYRHFSADEMRDLFEPLGLRVTNVRYDTFLGLYFYYRFVSYNPIFKKHLVAAIVPELAQNKPEIGHASSKIRRLLKTAAFGVLRFLRAIDDRFSSYRGCQIIEITLTKD